MASWGRGGAGQELAAPQDAVSPEPGTNHQESLSGRLRAAGSSKSLTGAGRSVLSSPSPARLEGRGLLREEARSWCPPASPALSSGSRCARTRCLCGSESRLVRVTQTLLPFLRTAIQPHPCHSKRGVTSQDTGRKQDTACSFWVSQRPYFHLILKAFGNRAGDPRAASPSLSS